VLAAVLLNTAFPAAAADAPSFYESALQRGLATYAKGDYAKAYAQLRIAAFGLIEDVPQYEMAQVHVILAADKLHHSDDARIAARRCGAARARVRDPAPRRRHAARLRGTSADTAHA
jgi:hypothetical protein